MVWLWFLHRFSRIGVDFHILYCVGLYSRFNKLEIDWEILLGKASDAPPETSLFD